MKQRMEYDFKVIGSRLKSFRVSNNLSVKEVARIMQIGSVQAVYKWERGDSLPQADTLMALLELYGVEKFSLITEGSEVLPSRFFCLLIPYALCYHSGE